MSPTTLRLQLMSSGICCIQPYKSTGLPRRMERCWRYSNSGLSRWPPAPADAALWQCNNIAGDHMTKRPRKTRTPKPSNATERDTKPNNASSAPQRHSKLDQMMELLKRPTGASIDELIAVTNWQRHSIRAAITKIVQAKRIGKIIRGTGEDGLLRYRAANGNANSKDESQQ
jgi:hypothetical protein